MNVITGRIIVKETGAGIPDLLIVVYDCDSRTLPEDVIAKSTIRPIADINKMKIQDDRIGSLLISEESVHKCTNTPIADIWQKIQGNRIGSVLTDANGRFNLEYDDTHFQAEGKDKRPDLVLFVVAPEDPSLGSCPPILHVSCGLRKNAGRIETYLIKLPFANLRKAGVSLPGMPSLSPVDIDMDDMLAKMKKLAEKRPEEETKGKPFSERYRERQQKLAEERKKAGVEERSQRNVALSFPIQIISGGENLSAAQIVPDEKEGIFLFKRSPETEHISLTFKGVKYSQTIENTAKGMSFVVDQEAKTFHISMPASPVKLELPDTEPSALYNFYQVQRKKAESADIIKKGTIKTTDTTTNSEGAPSRVSG